MLLAGLSVFAMTGCGDSNAIPEEEKKAVVEMQTAVTELDSASVTTQDKKADAKAAVQDLLNEFN